MMDFLETRVHCPVTLTDKKTGQCIRDKGAFPVAAPRLGPRSHSDCESV